MKNKHSSGLGKIALLAAIGQIVDARTEARESKLTVAYKEIQRYAKRLKIKVPSYNDFENQVEHIRLTTHHNFDEAIQIVCNEVMPYRYSY